MILCCGEALIDMLPRQPVSGEEVFLPVSGGAIFNTAISLGRLGARCGFLSGISSDMFGEQLIASLHGSNVETQYCIRSDRPTTLAFVKLVDGHAQYTFMDEYSAGRMLNSTDLPELPEEVEALHFGAISLIPEPCGEAYETLMADYHRSTVISLDPNIRPSFISDPDVHRARIRRMSEMSDIIKVSDEDLAWLTPEMDHQFAIDQMLENGTSIVVLTKGAAGIEVHTSTEHLSIDAKPAEVIDTIGAGDSFNGGFLKGLQQAGLLDKSSLRKAEKKQLLAAADLAATVAAYTVSQAGANPPWLRDIEGIAPTLS